MRPAAGTAWARYQAETTRHLGVCPDKSLEGETRELSGHQARNGRCGVVIQYRHRGGGGVHRIVWKPCRTRACASCGPWMRRQKLQRYQSRLDGWPVRLVVIAEDRWPTLQRRLNRARAQHLRIPVEPGWCAVLTTADQVGEPVTDVVGTLAELLERQPADDPRRVTSSAGWALTGTGVASVDDVEQGEDQEQEQEWQPVGIVTAGWDHALELAQELGIDAGPMAVTVGEARLLRFPEDREVWRRWKRWAGLVQDPPRQRRKRPKLKAA